MTSFSVEQKLRLASALREEQEKNQFALRKRESILSGEPLKELFTTDQPDHLTSSQNDSEDSVHSTFKIRFFLALILFVGFLWYDSSEITIQGIDSTVIYQTIQENEIFPVFSIQELMASFT